MASKFDPTALSNSEAERLHKRVRDAQEHIHSAQGQIHLAQGCLKEINNILSSRSTDTAASSPTSSDIPIKDIKAAQASLKVASPVKGAEAETRSLNVLITTDESKGIEVTGATEAPKFSNSPMTDDQASFLRNLLGKIKRTKHVTHFLEPVDHVALGLFTYLEEVKHPMDISTMRTKLWSSEYPSVQSFVDDLQLIADNAKTFNGPTHVITHAAYAMLIYAYDKLDKVPQPKGTPPPVHGRKRKDGV